ncbi:MAG: YesL family protein [Lachnospiraceae bacterium]|nr:YesL family protein [Lachnospiraceae bacterium]
MSNLFNPDNAVFTAINKIVDTIWLGILWTICSIPLITIGPASSALYYATVKCTRRSRSYVTREFFRSFKMNFKVGAIMSVIMLVYSFVLYIDFQYARSLDASNPTMATVYFVVFAIGASIAGVALLWMFPVLSRFTVGVGALFKSSFAMGSRHIVRTLLLALIAAFWILTLLVLTSAVELLSLLIFVPFIAPGLTSLIRSFIIEPVLKQHQGESAGDPEETGIDEWYRE